MLCRPVVQWAVLCLICKPAWSLEAEGAPEWGRLVADGPTATASRLELLGLPARWQPEPWPDGRLVAMGPASVAHDTVQCHELVLWLDDVAALASFASEALASDRPGLADVRFRLLGVAAMPTRDFSAFEVAYAVRPPHDAKFTLLTRWGPGSDFVGGALGNTIVLTARGVGDYRRWPSRYRWLPFEPDPPVTRLAPGIPLPNMDADLLGPFVRDRHELMMELAEVIRAFRAGDTSREIVSRPLSRPLSPSPAHDPLVRLEAHAIEGDAVEVRLSTEGGLNIETWEWAPAEQGGHRVTRWRSRGIVPVSSAVRYGDDTEPYRAGSGVAPVPESKTVLHIGEAPEHPGVWLPTSVKVVAEDSRWVMSARMCAFRINQGLALGTFLDPAGTPIPEWFVAGPYGDDYLPQPWSDEPMPILP